MAKVKMGVVVTGLRGTVGGMTFSANRAGNYAKVWTRSANARTWRQSVRRQALSVNAMAWRDLDPGDQAYWDAFGADVGQEQMDPFDNGYYLSGFQWSVKVNSWMKSVGRAAVSTPPAGTVPAAPTVTGFQVSAGATTCHFHYALGEFTPYFDAVVFVGMAAGRGNFVVPGPQPLVLGSQVPGGTSLDFTTGLMAVFGRVFVTQRAFLKVCRQTTDGYRSAAATAYANVIA